MGKLERLAFFTVTFTEFIYLTSGINNLLFACEKRVALGTDINTHCITTVGRTCGKGVATATCHGHFLVVWMDTWFHDQSVNLRCFSLELADHTQPSNPTQADYLGYSLQHSFIRLLTIYA